jgi:multiple sugar transport system substrate-binding protein
VAEAGAGSVPAALRGMAWDHPRARDPLAAISAAWSKERGISMQWDARPLKDFEDQPLEELATAYDLVLMDYPFVGTAATSGLISPVNDWADERYLEDQAAHSVGPSYPSYTWGGKQWALAIDAACQVGAVRDDLWAILERQSLPDTWAQVAELARELQDRPARVAIPLNPNHAYCAFLALGLGIAGEDFWPAHRHVHPEAGRQSLELLRALTRWIHPASRSDDPIGISDRMSRSNEIVYVPLMFGYSSYSRVGFRNHTLRFLDAPRGESQMRGSVLGGVGLALSSRSRNPAMASNLAKRIAASEVQSSLYADAGGQPGHRAAWDSAHVNAQTRDFFTATRRTMEQAFVRPRVPGHRRFQPLAGELVHRTIWTAGLSADACLQEWQRLEDALLTDGLAADAGRRS